MPESRNIITDTGRGILKLLGFGVVLIAATYFSGTRITQQPVVVVKNMDDRLESVLKEHCPGGELDQLCLDRLTVLNIPTRELQTLSGLEQCKNLERLDISAQYLSDRTCLYHLKDLSALSSLDQLNWLDISCNELPRADFLRGAKSLEYLDAAANRFYDFLPFTQLEQLETLDLHNNRIMRIQGFGTTTMLRELDLYGNPLVELTGLESLPHLEHLDIRATNLPTDRIKEISDALRARGVVVDS